MSEVEKWRQYLVNFVQIQDKMTGELDMSMYIQEKVI